MSLRSRATPAADAGGSGYWRRNVRLIAMLLLLWAAATFGVAWFAPSLDWNFYGWRFSYYMGAQGSLLIYLLIVWGYASYMRRVDRAHGVDDEADR